MSYRMDRDVCKYGFDDEYLTQLYNAKEQSRFNFCKRMPLSIECILHSSYFRDNNLQSILNKNSSVRIHELVHINIFGPLERSNHFCRL